MEIGAGEITSLPQDAEALNHQSLPDTLHPDFKRKVFMLEAYLGDE